MRKLVKLSAEFEQPALKYRIGVWIESDYDDTKETEVAKAKAIVSKMNFSQIIDCLDLDEGY